MYFFIWDWIVKNCDSVEDQQGREQFPSESVRACNTERMIVPCVGQKGTTVNSSGALRDAQNQARTLMASRLDL
eukprot:scaffold334_cov241-Pinguiococcus_pyrenoidosus.AAC.60